MTQVRVGQRVRVERVDRRGRRWEWVGRLAYVSGADGVHPAGWGVRVVSDAGEQVCLGGVGESRGGFITTLSAVAQ